MNIVLDASAAVELVLSPSERPILTRAVAEADWVVAPALFAAEVANAFWKCHRFGGLSQDLCAHGIDRCLALPDAFSDDRTLQVEAFSLACRFKHPVYDMLYLILASRHDAFLLSTDRALLNLARRHGVRTYDHP